MANEELVTAIRSGTNALKEWRNKNPFVVLDCSGAQLQRVKFDDMDLGGATFSGANLTGSAFVQGEYGSFFGIDFERANLERVIFEVEELKCANFTNAKLGGAELPNVDLFGTKLDGADLEGADLRGCTVMAAQLAVTNNLELAILDPGRFADAVAAGYVLMKNRPRRTKRR